MSFFDFLRDLRTAKPDAAKAARAMKVLGWVCLFADAGNFIVPQLMPFDRSPFKLPPDYPVLALAVFVVPGPLFFLSARGIAERASWGRRLGQAAVALLVAGIVWPVAEVVSWTAAPFSFLPAPVLVVFSVLFLVQVVAPAWFGISYLGRLPVAEDACVRPDERSGSGVHTRESAPAVRPAEPVVRYKDSPVPCGAGGTFIALLAVPLVGMLIAQQAFGLQVLPVLLALLFLLVFIGPVLYNRVVSPLEEQRSAVASYTGGGSIFLLNGSWPFFRLLVSADGVELRFMLHRYFIPCDRLEDLPERTGFFSGGVPFRSDLPGVPSSIRFSAFGSRGVLALVRE